MLGRSLLEVSNSVHQECTAGAKGALLSSLTEAKIMNETPYSFKMDKCT